MTEGAPDDLEPLGELLARHGLADVVEEPFPNDGWSGAAMTRLRRPDDRSFILKRDSLDRDWIAQATADQPVLREAWFAAHGPGLPWPARAPAFGAGIDHSTAEVAILMPDLSAVLFDWNGTVTVPELDAVLGALAAIHAGPWGADLDGGAARWTPWGERVTLICRPSLERPGPARDTVADRLLPGWDAWDRLATSTARTIIDRLALDPRPLLHALGRRQATLLHGDLKLANAGVAADGAVELVDWQMVMVAPVAIELGWFLVSNVIALPVPAGDVLDRYWARRPDVAVADRQAEDDLAILVGLLLRGWRKGADAASGATLGSGVSAADDLAWWCERAVEAAERVL